MSTRSQMKNSDGHRDADQNLSSKQSQESCLSYSEEIRVKFQANTNRVKMSASERESNRPW